MTAGAPPAIVVDSLRKTFGDFTAVDGVSFTVPTGSVLAVLGPNGAGKTTTVNMLCTLLQPDGGSAQVAGFDVAKDAAAVRRSIMLTGQFAALDESLTGKENLILFGRLMGLNKTDATERALGLLRTFKLSEFADRRVANYSGGMRRRIDIACGLVVKPTVVFLDEPTTGLDPRSRQEVWRLITQLKTLGVTVLLTTQYLEEADLLSDNIVVIDKGRVIAEGTADQLKTRIGGVYCEVVPLDPNEFTRTMALLSDLHPSLSSEDSAILVPAPHGSATLVEVVTRLAQARIELADVGLRRPSLDEVFLHLTGSTTSAPGA